MTALTAARGGIAGAYHLQIAFRDANGYAKGSYVTPDSVPANTTTHAYYVGGLDSFSGAAAVYEKVTIKAGQQTIGNVTLGISDFGDPTIQLAEYNEVLNAYIKGATADVTSVSGWAMNPTNINQVTFPRFITLIAAKWLHSTDLTEYWLNWIYHNVQWIPASQGGSSQAGGVNPNPLTYILQQSKSTRQVTGVTMSASSGTYVVGGSDTCTVIRSVHPLALTTYVANGSATTFTLGYRPFYSTVTTGNTDNSTTLNGVATAVTTISTTTGAVVMAAGTTADIWEVVYPTDFVAI